MIATPKPTPLPLPLPQRPYRGIDSFRLVDQAVFCARQKEVQKLIRAITIYRGVLLYGASGVGKSSLVNAGLLPEAIAGGFSPERIRVQPRLGQEIIVERIPLTTDGKPPYLASLFAGKEDEEPRAVLSAADLLKRLRTIGSGVYPLLIFDQFEEFVTLFEEAPQAAERENAAAAQEGLLAVLTELLRDHSIPVKLLFSFREDYLAKLNKLFSKYPTLMDQYLRLVPPDKSALPEIIRGPFRNEYLRQHFSKELSEEVATELVSELEAYKQGGAVNLSEVEIASLRLWESPDPAALLKRRHVQGLLEDYLADSLQRLGNLRDPAIALLSRLVTGRGTRNVISEDDLLQRVGKEEKVPEDRLRQALTGLEKDTGLVRRERRNDTYFYEIVSEFLVPWIRRQKQDREQDAKTRKFLLRVSLSAGLVVLLLGGALAWRTWTLSERVLVEEAQKKTTETIAQLEDLNNRLEAERDQFTAEEDSWQSKLDLAQAVTAQRDRELEDLRSQLASAASQQQELVSRLNQAQDYADSAQKQLSVCLPNFRRVEDERLRLSSGVTSLQEQLSSCQEKSRNAETVAHQSLNECEARAKEQCPGSYNVREVTSVFGSLQYDHKELKEELAALSKANLGPAAAHPLKKAMEQQMEAEQRIGILRRLLGLDSARPSTPQKSGAGS